MKLTKMDIRILDEIQNNVRISNPELADKIDLSPSPCLRRVRQLEEAGYIDQYVARLNEKKLDLKLIALIQISMDRHTPERFENFESIVQDFDEVQECYLITGQSADYLLKVIVPDMEHYQAFLLQKLTRIEGVTRVQYSFIMRKVLDRTVVPLKYLDV